MGKRVPLTVKRCHSDGKVSVTVNLNSGWGGDHVRLTGSTDLTCEQARNLARDLVAFADGADARAATKSAAELRRQAWREREIAAGRMIVLKGFR